MSDIELAYHKLRLDNACLRAVAQGWQDLFSSVMEISRPGDFVRVRAGGPQGDKKCDGYLKSTNMLYQCYGPRLTATGSEVAKIDEDFNGARAAWGTTMRGWTYVNNSKDGILGNTVLHLARMRHAHPGLTIDSMGIPELLTELDRTPVAARNSLLGAAPTDQALSQLRRNDLSTLLRQVGRAPATATDLRPVPVDKMDFNRFSDDGQTLLIAGARKSALVGHYFSSHHDPLYRDEVAGRLRAEYSRLRTPEADADDILTGLQDFVSGQPGIASASHQAAVLAIITYFFSECDIFERPIAATS